MKFKSLVLVLICLLVIPVIADDDSGLINEGVIEKPLEAVILPDFTPQVLKGEKPGVVITNVFVLSDGELEDFYDVNMVNYAATNEVYLFVTYTAMWNTNVKFHFIVTGPQYFSYTTDVYKPRYNTRSYVYVYGQKSSFFTKKGVYRLIVYAEQLAPFGGEAIVATCNFRVY